LPILQLELQYRHLAGAAEWVIGSKRAPLERDDSRLHLKNLWNYQAQIHTRDNVGLAVLIERNGQFFCRHIAAILSLQKNHGILSAVSVQIPVCVEFEKLCRIKFR
jgi:hypothetical protein